MCWPRRRLRTRTPTDSTTARTPVAAERLGVPEGRRRQVRHLQRRADIRTGVTSSPLRSMAQFKPIVRSRPFLGWSRPLGVSPHEELIPATAPTVKRSPVELSLVLPCHNAGPQLEAFIGSLRENLD